MKIVLLIFLSESLTENNELNPIETTRHEMSTEVSTTTNSQIATISSIGSASKYENYSILSSTSVMTTTEEALSKGVENYFNAALIHKITMESIQIVVKATIK